MIENTKTKPQETLKFLIDKQMQTPPINLVEEGKWRLGVTWFECTNSVSAITNENNSFSITITGHWISESAEKTIDELNKLLDLRSENDIEIHVEQVKKKRIFLMKDYSLSSFATFKNEILEELKIAKTDLKIRYKNSK